MNPKHKLYTNNIHEITLANTSYRNVIYTTDKNSDSSMQLVLMSLKPREEIGLETHPHTTQFISIKKGSGLAIVGDKKIKLKTNSIVIIPEGTKHNIINTSKIRDMKIYTIYVPSEHSNICEQRSKKNKEC